MINIINVLKTINLITVFKGILIGSLLNNALIIYALTNGCSWIKYTPKVKGPINEIILAKYWLYFNCIKNKIIENDCVNIGNEFILWI